MEAKGSSSSKKKKKGNRHDFNGLMNHLFSWTFEDLLNDDFCKDKVEKIPSSFKSVHHYLGSYIFPLLEETRAEISSSLKAIHGAPFAQVIYVENSKSSDKLLFSVKLDSWRNKSKNSGKEPYRTLPGDVFLILDEKPESVINLGCSSSTRALGWVRKIPDNGCSGLMKLHVSKDIRCEDGAQKTLFIVFLANVTTNLRIWNSLHCSQNSKIIKQVCSSKSMGDEVCNKCSVYKNAVCAEKLEMSLTSVLNDSQKVAVLSSVCKTFCDHKSSMELIWGPPGTGKTKTVSFLLRALLEINQRILACAPTNVAITELASRVLKLLKESSVAGAMFCPLGDMLLTGNKERLKVGPELEEIYLDYRVDRLGECLGQTGWKYHITSVIKILEGSCNSEYHMFLECNQNTSKGDKKKGDIKTTSFLGFIQDKFKSTSLALRGCFQTLTTHIPKKFLLEHNVQNMEMLLNLLDSFGMLLFQDDIVFEPIEIMFSCSDAVPYVPHSSVGATFLYLRSQCLSVLSTLLASLDQLQLPCSGSKKSVQKLCLQWASLIFCTASSSFKLNSVKMDPVSVLVIDEAAQLKESESIIPLQLPGIKHAILIGDEFQLPAIVSSKVCDGAGYGRSLFERLSLLGHSKHLLNTQYRMHPSISCLPSLQFYSSQILDAAYVTNKVYEKRYLSNPMFGPYSFINVPIGSEEGDDDGHSKKNMVEVAVVTKIIERLYKAWKSAKTKLSIGVISFYTAQVLAIQSSLGCKYEKNDNFSVKVKTVDGFQGGEEDVIILSTVRSNRRKTIGFISNSQRINVALTRARHCLWIVGDATTLGCSNSEWEAVVSNAKDRRCFFNVEEDKDLVDAILEAKKVLIQLDDLLNKDSILFKIAQWKVLLSDSFRASFQKVKSIHQKKSVIVILLRLSSGRQPESEKLSVPQSSNIIKHVKVDGLHIIYSLDIEKGSKYNQVLKIWDIKPLEDVKELVQCLSNIYEMYTDDFLNHCKAKSVKGGLEIPITWSASYDIIRYKDHTKAELNGIMSSDAHSDEDKNFSLKRKLLQMKFQSLSYQKANHLLSGRESKELDLPCQVEDGQLEIILCPVSAFIIGRPCAEKTEALTMKLFQREQHKLIHPGEFKQVEKEKDKISCEDGGGENSQNSKRTAVRQLFITSTLKQCLAVKEHFSYLKRISYGVNNLEENQNFNKVGVLDVHDAENFLDIPSSFNGIPSTSYPLVITFRKFLMMLDGTVGDSYFARFHKQWKLSCGKPNGSISTVAYCFIKSKEVTPKFASSYWPYLDNCLTSKLDAFLVYNEITSQIKGGLGAKETHDGKLSREDYVLLSKGRSSMFSRKQRERIYDVFLDYERLKKGKGEYDLADLVINLHSQLNIFQYTGDQMDFVYVDEVQALTMTQIALLKYLCRNVNSGFVFSSNTSQTIAKGVAFRLQDIRFMFYKEFMSESKTDEEETNAPVMKISDILHMNQNLHTQPKILRLANSVMDLLFRFFPHCVDIMCPETNEMNSVTAETPVLLESMRGESMMKILFEETENITKGICGFGARQIILVRDEYTKEAISNFIGNRALVLTIMECECLEFQDVLLYNFFSSSPVEHHWRIIYQYMMEQDLLEIAPNSPSFGQRIHMDLCWELKLLYVAITRSRQRLWICEDGVKFSNPIFDYWKKLCHVQIKPLDSSIIQAMQVSSIKEEWSSLGVELFCEGLYGAASFCFQRAEDTLRKEWAMAASLCVNAGILHCSNPQMASSFIHGAAGLYISIDRAEAAARCLVELKEYKEAAHIYLTKCGEVKLEEAGDCYMLAECYTLAAETYSRGSCLDKFLNVCSIANLFDMGLQVVQSSRKYDDNDLIEKSQDIKEMWHVFLTKGARHYHQRQDLNSMMKFVKAFNSMDETSSFLRTLDFSDKILLLEKEENKAVNTVAEKGDILREIDVLEKAGNFKDASLLILLHVLFSSLWGSGKKGWPLKLFKRKEKLITRAKILAMNESDAFYEYVCAEADILSNQTTVLFELEENWSASHRHGNLRGKILSAWRILDAHLSSSTSKYKWEDTTVIVSHNQVTVQSLVYFWNFWKESISLILQSLQLSETEATSDYTSYEEFCVDYLGLRKQFNQGKVFYLLIDPEVEWAKKVTFQGSENMVSINSQDFVAAAQRYWCSEVFAVGFKVLLKLKDLLMLSVRSSLSLNFQAFTAVHIFEIVKFLAENDYIKSFIDSSSLRTIFELGLHSIMYLRLYQTPNAALADEIQAVYDNSQSYLMNCALHFHEIQDTSTMLKFVKAFCSMDSKRSFLKSFNYFNELLAIEMEARNYAEALAIAVSQGNFLLEVDLLEKMGNYKEASLLLVFYICASSLWTSGSEGWPLKEFKHKQKLIERAKSIAKQDSETLYYMISTEAEILSCKVSSLVEMERCCSASESFESLRGAILSSRKILDAHLQLNDSNYVWENVILSDPRRHIKETISRNLVSFETLVYFWNFWRDNLINIFDYLCAVETQDVSNEYKSQQDFCLSYLGARRQSKNQETLFILLNSDADWAKEVVGGSHHTNGGLVSIDASQFASAGWKYWSLELLSVGLKVLEKLKALYFFSSSHSTELCQGMIGIKFCEVGIFLENSKFLKRLPEGMLQKLAYMGLEFILCCKIHLGQDSFSGSIHELNDLKHAFLRKCALHYHRLQDQKTMMKFVEAFDSIDSKRTFLKSLSCFDELLSLEEESGNFMEAVAIARLKGDILLEVDLLQKAGRLEEPVELILFYVLANYLWTSQSKGWTLKQFEQKEKLLSKAKSLAELHSDALYRIVCTEISILSDGVCSLLDMKHHLSSFRENKNICGEILSARKILDAHLCLNTSSYSWEDEVVTDLSKHVENKISQNQVSIETLFHFWNFWKDSIMGTIKYLELFSTGNVDEFAVYEGFCLKYFSLRKQFDNQNTYQLLIPDADWLMHMCTDSLQRNGKLISLDVQKFAPAAKSYWNIELLSVGMKVLEHLRDIHRFSLINCLPKFHQSLAAIHIFEISNFLISSKILKLPVDGKKLRLSLESSADNFFDNVFGWSWINPMTESMISLREAKHCRNIIEAVISKTINSDSDFSYEKLGKVVMVLLGSGKLTSELYDMIAMRLHMKPHWKAVVDSLKKASEVPESSRVRIVDDDAAGEVFLINQLHGALELTFVNWKKEPNYMSPDCFLYIVERHFILASMLQGCFYTTRSSFVEWLIFEGKSSWPRQRTEDIKISSNDFFDFIAKIVHELLFNNCGAREWMKRSNLDSKKYYPIFMLRLVIIMCLLCANSGQYYDVLYDLLGKPDVCSQLPRSFTDLYRKRKKQSHHFLNFIAKAVWEIKNPLVKVCSRDICRNPVAPKVITIKMKNVCRKEEIWKLLFKNNQVDDRSCRLFSDSGGEKAKLALAPLNCNASQVLLRANDNDNRDGAVNKPNSNKKPEPLKSNKDSRAANFKIRKSNASKIKINLKKNAHCVNASNPKSFQKGSIGKKDELLEMKRVLDELISPTLNVSEPKLVKTVKELARKLQLQKQKINTSSTVRDASQITDLSAGFQKKRRTGKDLHEVNAANETPIGKGSSQKLQFQPKLDSVQKEIAAQIDMETEGKMKTTHIVSTSKENSQKLLFKPKLESVKKDITAGNDLKPSKDAMKFDDNVARSTDFTQELQFKTKLEPVQKEKLAGKDLKSRIDEMKSIDNISRTKEPAQNLQAKPKLEFVQKGKTVDNDLKSQKDEMKSVDNMSRTKEPVQNLKAKPKLEFVQKGKTVGNDLKSQKDEMKYVDHMSRIKEPTQNFQVKPKLKSVQKGKTIGNDLKSQKNEMKSVDNMSRTMEPSRQNLKAKPKLEFVQKGKTVGNDLKSHKDEMKSVDNMPRTKEHAEKLQFKAKIVSVQSKVMAKCDSKSQKDEVNSGDNAARTKEPSRKLQLKKKLKHVQKET